MTFCVYCGAPLTDAGRCNSCGAVKVGQIWHEPAHNVTAGVADGGTGWRPDPTGRHEGRYFVSGQPTDLIRDGGVEALDSLGKQQLDHSVGEPDTAFTPGGGKRRRAWVGVAAAALVLALLGGGVAAYAYVNRDRTTVDDKYLVALKQAGLSGEFNSDANAVAHGKQVCRSMQDGSPQQGMPADEVAVQYFCPQFVEGFHVLETAAITGSFTLNDENPNRYAPAIEVNGSSCTGAGGYSDVNPGTPVTVKNGKGDILTSTYLEPGKGGRYMCTFSMTFEVTEGEDQYVVSVGRRGELSFTFDELKANGVALVLG
ncbi:DUF732 domain-containing protein [Mycobacterium sp. ZZG]